MDPRVLLPHHAAAGRAAVVDRGAGAALLRRRRTPSPSASRFGDVGDDERRRRHPSDGGIAWLVSRELLQSRSRPARPATATCGSGRRTPPTDVLFLHLRAPSGEALFELSRATVAAFLRQTETLVPPGTRERRCSTSTTSCRLLLSNGGADPSGR